MPTASSHLTRSDLRLFVFVPRDEELAEFVQDALAFTRITLRVGRSLAETITGLREHVIDALLVDIDTLTPAEAGQLQAGITEVRWRGRVIAVGTATAAHREQLAIAHQLGAKLTSLELRNALLAIAG